MSQPKESPGAAVHGLPADISPPRPRVALLDAPSAIERGRAAADGGLLLRLTLESVAECAIAVTGPDGRIRTWTAGAAGLFQYAPGEVLGRPLAMLFTPEDRSRHVPSRELRRAREWQRTSADRWFVRKDGARFLANSQVATLVDNGRLIGFSVVVRDLTEQHEWERSFQRAHADVEARVEARTREMAALNEALDVELRGHRQAAAQVRRLLRRLVTVQEDERRRIARDLHDHLGQQMTALRLKLSVLGQRPDVTPGLREQLQALDRLTMQMDRDLSFLAWELRPSALDDLGLPAALGRFVQEWCRTCGILAEFTSTGLDGRLSFEIETNLYRIAQEALHNVFKHAGASRVSVRLETCEGDVLLQVEDNGRGLAPDTSGSRRGRGLGLAGMRERAALAGGSLTVDGSAGDGTRVEVRVPLVFARA